jgi:ribonuclease HII
MAKIKYLVGIDEVGRGPLAGPVAIGAVLFDTKKIPSKLLSARDSKALTPIAREIWFQKIKAARIAQELDYRVAFVGQEIIDEKGIMYALRTAIARALSRLALPPQETMILLDGGLRAPEHFIFQQTIIGGDRKEPIISLASITAKVLRDRKMWRLAEEFPHFGFEEHKGYGTRFHIKQLKKYGPCELHRRSFIKNILA